MDLKTLLDQNVISKNTHADLFAAADPLQVASKFKTPETSLICALFAYGNAKLIVNFLNSLDFSLLDKSEEEIISNLMQHKYRFQSCEDVRQIFITVSRLKKHGDIESAVREGFEKGGSMIDGINELIKFIYSLNS